MPSTSPFCGSITKILVVLLPTSLSNSASFSSMTCWICMSMVLTMECPFSAGFTVCSCVSS